MPFLLILLLLLAPLAARADSLVGGLPNVATTPMAPGACLYVDQVVQNTDARACAASPIGSSMASFFGSLAISNNLSEVANPATARANLLAAPLASPTFTGTVTIPALSQPSTGALAANADFVKAQEFSADAGWVNQTPNAVCIHIAHQPEKVTGINGRVTVAAASGATVTPVKVPSTVAVASGTALTTTPNASLLADQSLNTNQTLTLTGTAASLLLAAGDALCLQASGTFSTSNATITVSYVKQ